MSTLTVGFDFSKGSVYALNLAIDVANRCEYDIKVVWVEDPKESKKENKEDILKKLEETITEYQPKLKQTKLSFVARKGKVFNEIVLQSKEDKTGMIIIGAHGKSGYNKKKIGSSAFGIVENAPCPVLIIREDFNFDKKLEKILLPLDSSEATRQKVPYAANMANIFGSKICLLGIYTSKMVEMKKLVNRFVKQSEDFLKKEQVPYSTEFVSADNITTATLEYGQSIQADLIIIMTEQERALTNIFKGSYSSQMVNTSPIPVLSVHPEEINAVAK